MICKHCQAEIPEDSNVCPWCGGKVAPDEEAPAAQAQTAEMTTEAAQENGQAAGIAEAVETAETAETVEEPLSKTADGSDDDTVNADGDAPADADETAAPDASDNSADFAAAQIAAAAPKSNKSAVAVVVLSILLVACLGVLAFMMIRSFSTNTPPVETAAQTDAADAEDAFPDGFDYTAVDLAEYVKLGAYKDITVSLTTSSEIADKDVADYIENVLVQNTVTNEVDRAAAVGDELVIDFAGTIDGVAFPGGTAQDRPLTLGAGGFIAGFEEGIVGMRAGETKVVDVTFPEDYGNEELNGKTAQFEITVKSVGEKVKPQYNETFVKEVLKYDSIEAYEEFVIDTLTKQREQEIENEKQSAVLSQINENATVLKYPEGLAENYAAQQIATAKSYAERYGVDYETFVAQGLGMTAAEYEEDVLADAREYVKETMVLFAIAEAENLMPTEEQRAEELQSFLAYYGYEDVAAMCEDYGLTEAYIRNLLNTSIATNAAVEFVINNATYIGAK